MLGLIALAYLLLCLRLQICVQAAVSGREGSFLISVNACGLSARYDGSLIFGKEGRLIRILPRSRKKKESSWKKKAGKWLGRRLWSYVRRMILDKRLESVTVHARLGLGDASATAVACGAVHALACALLTPVSVTKQCDIRIRPDFSGVSVSAFAQGIFSCQPGDIMLAALKSTLHKQRVKEGFGWKSIPLRA